MATRRNTCSNPCLTNDVAGWGGGSAPTRTPVVGFGRPFAARYTAGTFSSTARCAVAAGLTYTFSEYVYIDNVAPLISGSVYVEWRNAGGGVITYSNAPYSAPGRTVTRVSVTATAPAGAVTAEVITDNYNFGTGPGDFTMVLAELGEALLAYFDGDTAGARWDGAPGNSSSTLEDEVTEGPGRLSASAEPLAVLEAAVRPGAVVTAGAAPLATVRGTSA
ncbi:hypothetical protein [Nonomuraea ceibae]|uniref:hypothetical protein n=1 Tax=Nonomuraea ceibae TaxID=1935170 RepID=UPI001C5EC8E3|nr:hypothetical protein [Nonomuraea ceibae]